MATIGIDIDDTITNSNRVVRYYINKYSNTTTYLREFGLINQAVAGMADKVVELVCGIPLIVKESANS